MGDHDDPFDSVVSAWELMNAYLSPPERDELVDAVRRALRGARISG